MSVGILVKCKEDMEVINLNAQFHAGIYYTLLEDSDRKLWVVSREHIPVNVSNRDIFNKHFDLR